MDKIEIKNPKNPAETLLTMEAVGTRLVVADCRSFDVSSSDHIFSAVREELFKEGAEYTEVYFDFSITQNLTSAALRHFSQLLEDCTTDRDIKVYVGHASVSVANLITLSGYAAVLNMVDLQEA